MNFKQKLSMILKPCNLKIFLLEKKTTFTKKKTMGTTKHNMPFAICTSPMIHLVCPQNFAEALPSFSWDDCNTQLELKKKVMKNFAQQTRCIVELREMVYGLFCRDEVWGRLVIFTTDKNRKKILNVQPFVFHLV